MPNEPLNGTHLIHKRLDKLESGITEIRDDLPISIDKLTQAVNSLSATFNLFMEVAEKSVPIKAVYWLLGIMILGLIGVEGVKQIGPLMKFITGAP